MYMNPLLMNLEELAVPVADAAAAAVGVAAAAATTPALVAVAGDGAAAAAEKEISGSAPLVEGSSLKMRCTAVAAVGVAGLSAAAVGCLRTAYPSCMQTLTRCHESSLIRLLRGTRALEEGLLLPWCCALRGPPSSGVAELPSPCQLLLPGLLRMKGED